MMPLRMVFSSFELQGLPSFPLSWWQHKIPPSVLLLTGNFKQMLEIGYVLDGSWDQLTAKAVSQWFNPLWILSPKYDDVA